MKIVLTGTYSSANKGDAAMQQVFAAEVLRRRPDADVIIASPFAERDTAYHAPTAVVRSRRRNLPVAIVHWLALESNRRFGNRIHRYPWDQEIDAMADADAIVDLSGDMLTEDYGPIVGLSHFLPLLQAQALGKPVFICAQSIGPFRRLKSLARSVLKRSKLITVRETHTIPLIAALNETTIAPTLTADLAFLLPPVAANRLTQIQAAEGIPPRSGRRLGISVSALLSHQSNRHLASKSGSSLEAFAVGLDRIAAKHGVELLLIPHVFGPRRAADDRTAIENIIQRMKSRPYTVRSEYRPEELKALISTCDAFVGCRMHANIAALDSGVPILAIGYSHKTQGILNQFDMGDRVLAIEDLTADRLVTEVDQLLEHTDTYREHVTARLPLVRAAAARNIDLIIAAIESSPPGPSAYVTAHAVNQATEQIRRQ